MLADRKDWIFGLSAGGSLLSMDSIDLDAYRTVWLKRVDVTLGELLEQLCGDKGCPVLLGQAMRHALLSGGKRLRPLLCLASVRAAGMPEERGLWAACSLEFIHAYSLVHDDLPAMDDDDYRRGQPSCHRAFGQATAILAGDALLTHSFGVLAEGIAHEKLADAVMLLARCAGASGMVGGQVDDVLPDGSASGVESVESVHARKTGTMFEAAVRLGGLVAGAPDTQLEALSMYGQTLGLAYQIVDDLLAWSGNIKILKRPTGSDQAQGRRTHPLTAGAHASRKRVAQLVQQALGALQLFGSRADVLRGLANLVARRAG